MQLGHHGRRWTASDFARVRLECETTTLSSVKIGVLLSKELHRTAASITTMIAELHLRTKTVKRKTHYTPRYTREDQLALTGADGRPADDGHFARAMRREIAAGTENPLIGVNKHPGTKAPRALEHSSSLPTKNVLADV